MKNWLKENWLDLLKFLTIAYFFFIAMYIKSWLLLIPIGIIILFILSGGEEDRHFNG